MTVWPFISGMTSYILTQIGSDSTNPLRNGYILDVLVLLGFAVMAVATYFLTTITLPISLLVAFPAYAVRYISRIPFDGPDKVVFIYYFLAVGVLIAH